MILTPFIWIIYSQPTNYKNDLHLIHMPLVINWIRFCKCFQKQEKKCWKSFGKSRSFLLKLLPVFRTHLTLSWRRPLSYRNQSTENPMDWFLYDNGHRHERVNLNCFLMFQKKQVRTDKKFSKFFGKCKKKLVNKPCPQKPSALENLSCNLCWQ